MIGLMNRYLRGLLDPIATLLEVHKLMYFMHNSGQRLGLRFSKDTDGPYAQDLGHVLHAVEGHLLSGFAEAGNSPGKQLEPVPGVIKDAVRVRRRSPRTRERFDRVVDLVDGFASSFGLELLSTVHWVPEHELPASKYDLVERTHDWSKHKKRFSPRQIGLAVDVLATKGWLDNSGKAARH